jgi:hypothetical protein
MAEQYMFYPEIVYNINTDEDKKFYYERNLGSIYHIFLYKYWIEVISKKPLLKLSIIKLEIHGLQYFGKNFCS